MKGLNLRLSSKSSYRNLLGILMILILEIFVCQFIQLTIFYLFFNFLFEYKLIN